MSRDADCPLHSDYKLLPITYYLLPITPYPLDSTRLGNPSRVVRITRAFAFMVALMEEEEEPTPPSRECTPSWSALECLTRVPYSIMECLILALIEYV